MAVEEPIIVKAMRRNPTGLVHFVPESGPGTGTTARGLLAELDEWLAAVNNAGYESGRNAGYDLGYDDGYAAGEEDYGD